MGWYQGTVKRKAEAEGKQSYPALEEGWTRGIKQREIAIETRRKARDKNTGWNFNNIDQPQRQ